MKFLPAILTPNVKEFKTQLDTLFPHFDRFSVDIQDGKFVPTFTQSTSDLLSFFATQNFTKNTIFDFDLMTYDFESALDDIEQLAQYITIGNIFVHFSLINKLSIPIRRNLTIGLALNPPDTIDILARQMDLSSIPCIQVMTIYAGPQGQPFIPKMLNKIGLLKNSNYRNTIYIDGAVNNKSIPTILSEEYRPNFACVGSFLSKAGNELNERIKYLKALEE